MGATKHLFPLRLDGAVQTVSGAAAWNGTTSLVNIDTDGTYDFDLIDAELPGTLLTIERSASGSNSITVKSPADASIVALDSATDTVCLIYTGSEWKTLANATASGTLSTTNLSLSGTLGVGGNTTMSANATVAGTLGVTGAATFTAGAQSSSVARTATADGTGTGTIAAGTAYVTVTCDDANKIIILPTPTPGTVLHIFVGANGFALRSNSPGSVAINGGSGSNAESAVAANTLVKCVCTSATTWVANTFAADGTEAKLTAAA